MDLVVDLDLSKFEKKYGRFLRKEKRNIYCVDCKEFGHSDRKCPKRIDSSPVLMASHSSRASRTSIETSRSVSSTHRPSSDEDVPSKSSDVDRDELRKMKKMVKIMKKNEKSLGVEVMKKEERILELTRRLTSFEETAALDSSMTEVMTQLETSLVDADRLIESLRSEIVSMTAEMQQRDERISDLTSRVTAYEAERSSETTRRTSIDDDGDTSRADSDAILGDSLSEAQEMIATLRRRECELSTELEESKNTIQRLVTGTARLDTLLSVGRSSEDRRGLGYVDTTSTPSTSQTIFVKSIVPQEDTEERKISPRLAERVDSSREQDTSTSISRRPQIHSSRSSQAIQRSRSRVYTTMCDHCGKAGHIKAWCRQLRREQKACDEVMRQEAQVATETHETGLGHSGRYTSPSTSRLSPAEIVPAETSADQTSTPQRVMEKEAAKGKGPAVHTQRVTHLGPRTPAVHHTISRGPSIPTCHHCGERGHIRPRCPHRRRPMSQTSRVDPRQQETIPRVRRAPTVHRRPPTHHLPSPTHFIPTCHHCGRRGHVRPQCFELMRSRHISYGGRRSDIRMERPRDGAHTGHHLVGLIRQLQRLMQTSSVGLVDQRTPPVQTFRGQSTHVMRTPACRREWRPRSG